ncbi:MAG: molybdopterin-dependent oxidoreductase [Deltaproteobacteria bacterium]|nr:molybdopterin-dependent oxidoreductase [Deltaproteobacteria bacterium]
MTTKKSGLQGSEVTVVPTGGCYDCGGRCVLKVHVKDGVAIRVDADDGEEPQLRACARGRAMRRQMYSPDRLLFPQKRVGLRGEGKFERISWDEALDTVAGELTRIKETCGPKAILGLTLSGGVGALHTGPSTLHQFLNSFGGFTHAWGDDSAEGAVFAARSTYGTLTNGNNRDDLLNSRLIILWGLNPATSIFSTNTSYWISQAKEAGARIFVIDPRYTNTAATFADQWIPIKPGTDTAMMAAMAYVMITEDIHDTKFLNTYTIGFDKFKDYVLGAEDGTAKTPDWAQAKTGVSADTIISLARKYATTRPAALIAGFAPGRSAFGEQFHRVASTLAAMTGNVGLSGGGAGGFERSILGPMVPPGYSKLFEGGPYEARLKQLDVPQRLKKRVHACRLWDAILEGTAGGYPEDYKMAYIAFNNPLNQYPNINKGIKALKKLEFIVVHEQFMTATAKFADILLPVTTVWERNDIARPWVGGPYFLYQNKVIDPPADVKSDFEICRELASRLGIEDPYGGMSEEEVVRLIAESMEDVLPEVGDFEKFKQDGVHKIKRGPQICFKEQIEDPENNPFPTLSGKIEIYSQLIADLNDPDIPAIPRHIDPWEGPEDPLAERYPLQLISTKIKSRAHSCFENHPWLKELDPQSLWLSTRDAQSRGIENGEKVRVFNDRGETIIQARVTECIMPGVVFLGEGAWYRPDDKGRDRAGNPNMLTNDNYSPGGAFPFNTCLVQAEKGASQ